MHAPTRSDAVITMRYSVPGEPVKIIEIDDSRLDEVLARCDAKFCAPLSPERERAFRQAQALGLQWAAQHLAPRKTRMA